MHQTGFRSEVQHPTTRRGAKPFLFTTVLKRSHNLKNLSIFLIIFYTTLTLLQMMMVIYTALRNHMRIVFEEMSSWTPLTMYLGMKTTFENKFI